LLEIHFTPLSSRIFIWPYILPKHAKVRKSYLPSLDKANGAIGYDIIAA
jgi:hypothetical protein